MRIFLTGATGFIGSALIPELLNSGHQVLGLTRSDKGAQALLAAGAEPHRGDIEDLDSLRRGAATVDGVIHTAFNHDAFSQDFSQFGKTCEDDRKAIAAMGEVLLGSNRPFVVTSGTAIANSGDGKPATEESPATSRNPRAASEAAAAELTAHGGNISIVRLPQVHDPHKQGLVPYITALARLKGKSVYIGDGANCWPAAHISDVAQLYRLAFERAESGAIYHAVDEEGVPMRDIAESLSRGLKVPVLSIPPEQAEAHFGWLAHFAGADLTASSVLTRQKLDWHPNGPGLIADLEQMQY